MDNNFILREIASKAEYISDVARNALYQMETDGKSLGTVDVTELRDILRQLENIAEAIDEYHNWEED